MAELEIAGMVFEVDPTKVMANDFWKADEAREKDDQDECLFYYKKMVIAAIGYESYSQIPITHFGFVITRVLEYVAQFLSIPGSLDSEIDEIVRIEDEKNNKL